MNHLVSVRTNILYGKKDKKEERHHEDEFNKFHELIFLIDKPFYKRSTEGEIIRERGVEEARFIVSEKAFDDLIKILVKLKDADESELS